MSYHISVHLLRFSLHPILFSVFIFSLSHLAAFSFLKTLYIPGDRLHNYKHTLRHTHINTHAHTQLWQILLDICYDWPDWAISYRRQCWERGGIQTCNNASNIEFQSTNHHGVCECVCVYHFDHTSSWHHSRGHRWEFSVLCLLQEQAFKMPTVQLHNVHRKCCNIGFLLNVATSVWDVINIIQVYYIFFHEKCACKYANAYNFVQFDWNEIFSLTCLQNKIFLICELDTNQEDFVLEAAWNNFSSEKNGQPCAIW